MQPSTAGDENSYHFIYHFTYHSLFACQTGCTLNTSAWMLRKGHWKYVVYTGFDPQLFNLESDPEELVNKAEDQPELVAQLDRELRSIADYEQAHSDWQQYCRQSFRQWRRQAGRGLYVDNKYSLQDNPSSDYWAVMNNCFTGYDQQDERTVLRWLDGKRS